MNKNLLLGIIPSFLRKGFGVILLLCLGSLTSSLYASHALGAELTYSCTGNANEYQITLKFFRDCDGIAAPDDASVAFTSLSGCGGGGNVALTQQGGGMEITPLCPGETSTCSNGTIDGVQVYTYTGTVTLPAQCTDWVFSYDLCCRNGLITNLSDPDNEDIYVQTTIDNTIAVCNNSPIFNTPASFLGCAGQTINYNHGVTDADGDDLVFSFVDCMEGPGDSVEYAGGFSGTNPINTTAGGGLIIDASTGAISFTPNGTQVAVLCVKVEEFRNGVKIGEVFRDIQFNIIDCSGPGANMAPSITGGGIGGSFTYNATIGNQVCIDIASIDPNGDNMSLSSLVTIPGGTFTPPLPINLTANPMTQFCWTPTAAEAGTSQFFTITVEDDGCPVTGSNTYTYEIFVVAFDVVCPTTTDLGTYDCTNLANIPAEPTTPAEVIAAPYNIAINATVTTTPVVTSSDSPTLDVCATGTQVINRSVTVLDDLNGNGVFDIGEGTQTCVYTITLNPDMAGPTIVGVPASILADCDAIPGLPNPVTAMDDCDPNPSVTFNETTTAGPCAHEYTINRMWTATDACGNSTVSTQFISVSDSEAPMFIDAPDNMFDVECDAIPDLIDLMTTDNCDVGEMVSPIETIVPGACTNTYNIVRQWVTSDACGNSAFHSQLIQVVDNTEPTLVGVPADATATCNTIPALATPTAMDNCDMDVDIAFNEVNTPGSCADNFTLERTWTATDNCGNVEVQTQTITVADTTPPTIDATASDMTVECDGTGNTTALTTWLTNNGGAAASDVCSGTVTWSNDFGALSDLCAATGAATVTFTATDACGQASTTTATFTIQDTTPPTIDTAAGDMTVECDGAGNTAALTTWLTNNGGAAASDVCSGTVTWSNDFGALSDLCGATGATTVVFTATDDCGQTATTSATFTIQDTTPPTIDTAAGDMTVECDGAGNTAALNIWLANNGSAVASDACSSPITWSNNFVALSDLCGATGATTVVFTATDDCGQSSVTTATFTIEDITAPTITTQATDLSVECDGSGNNTELTDWLNANGNAVASDVCSGPVNWTNDFAGLTGGCGATGASTVAFTATDDCGQSSVTTATFTITGNAPPTIDTAASDMTVECDGAGNTTALTTWLTNNAGAVANDICSGTVTWSNDFVALSDDCGATGTATVIFTATDACLNTVQTTATFTIADTTPPTIDTAAGDMTVECDGTGNTTALTTWLANNGGAVASDVCSGVTWSNDFVTLSDDCGATGTATVTFTATDACGQASTTSATFTIADTTAPTIDTAAGAMTVECDGTGNTAALNTWLANNGGAVASDACGGVTWSNDFVTLSDDCAATGSTTVIFTATDACSLAVSTTATFTIQDLTPPTIVVQASDSNVECNGAGNTAQLDAWLLANGGAAATDVCGTVTWSNDFVALSDDCGATGTATVTFTATDDCGLTATTTGVFTIEDSLDPTLICPPNRDYTGCGVDAIAPDLPFSAIAANVPDIGALGGAASETCGTVTVSYMDTQAGACPDPITITRTYTATDDCGNTAVCTQIITVVDSAAPTISCPPARTYVGCGTGDIGAPDLPFSAVAANVGDITLLGGTAMDDCAIASLTYIDTQAGGCPTDLVVTRTYTATDACGNSISCTQEITIQDTTPPMITAAGMPVTFQGCDITDIAGIEFPFSANAAPVPTGTGYVMASDNCNLTSFTYSDVESGGCPADITITRTYVATDACGNTDQAIQIITIEDTTAPTITACPVAANYEGCSNADIGADNLPFSAIDAVVADFATIGGAANDACSLTVTYIDTEAGTCPDPIVITRTYTASDDCGNTTQCVQIITINDTTAPTITTCPPNRTYEGCSSTDVGGVDLPISLVEAPVVDIAALGGDFTDNCNIATVTYFDTETGACPDPVTITRTYTATDDCGNTAQCVQTIMIEDTTPPVALCQDITIMPDAVTGMATVLPADIDNGSSDVCSAITLALDIMDFTCADLGDNPVVLTVTDACGNSSTCNANVFIDTPIEKPLTRNAFHCIGKDVSANEGMEAICMACAAGGNTTIEWFTTEFGGTPIATGAFFNPIALDNPALTGVPADAEGCYTFYAQCRCDNSACPSFREKASFEVLDCEIDCADGCTYFLVLEDAGCDGWDAANIDVSLNEEWPATNHKLFPQDCNGFGNFKVIPLQINDGGTIDLAYWNGALEHEHAYALLNYAKDTVYATGYDLANQNTLAPQGSALNFKANCPACCVDELEDFTVRITMGDFPEEQSWEIYDGTENNQGTQVMGITATSYTGLAPGSQVTYDIQLEKCANYTFVAFDGFNDSWNGGAWEIITANLSYGTEITNPNDALFGNSRVMSGPANAGFTDEDRVTLTIPCQSCYDAPIDIEMMGMCTNIDVNLPAVEPFVCYPNCNHALPNGCVAEELIVLVDSDPFQAVNVANGPFTYVNGVAVVAATGLSVGDHKLVQVTTYCDGVISKCTTDLNIVLDQNPNPALTCNDLLHVSLATPEWSDDDNNTGNPYQDDLGECVIEVTPDMVLEMPNICENEYKVTILDADGQPLVIYDVNGLPLDEAGFSIPEGNQSSTPANNFVSAAQAGQTLTYVVEHIFSGNACWGEILVEDKFAPTIVCVDYDVACTHPEALNENYTHTDVYAPTMELPANIAGGTGGTVSNTFIPVNMPCGALGEIIQSIEVTVDLTHNDVTDLQVFLHAPTATGLAPMLLATNNQVGASNTWSNTPALVVLMGMPCSVTESTSPEDFITENSGNNVPANMGGTWYIQIVDNNATFPTPPYGGGEVTAASVSLTCGFPFPYAAYDCTLQSVTLLDEVIDETLCNQEDWNGAVITRIWQAEDAFGHTSTCVQTVSLKAPTFNDIIWPTDVVLNCDGDIDPIASTGVLAYDCFPMLEDESSHGLCDVSYTYEDQTFDICGNGYKIHRHWTAINWCSGTIKEYTQVIKLEDQEGPVINIADIVSNTAVYDCNASLSFNEAITDGCSSVTSIEVRYTLGGGAYASEELVIVDVTNGGSVENLPLGVTEIMVIATDECYNTTEELVSVTIEDNTPPVAACNDNLNISLGSDGQAWIYAEDIDEGSWDNCGVASLEVRRVGGCLGNSDWADSAPVDCCDVDQLVTIELRVTDNAGNTNICWQTVLVEDALAPTVTCPANVTVDCNDPLLQDLAGFIVFGDATYDDNCSATTTLTETDNRDECKAGTISRRWVVTDSSAKSQDVNCTQTITVNHVSDFIVQFPADVTVSTCPDDLGLTGAPTLSNDDCELVAINHDDLVLTIVDDACYKIERTWTLINWCIYDQGNPANTDLGIPQPLPRTYQDDDGYFTYTQTINVLDGAAPTITCPGDQTFCDLTDGCEGEAQLTIVVEDGCSPAEALEYTFKIDLDNDGEGNFDIIDAGNDATAVYPYGTHLIRWIVEDGCGNNSTCEYLFTIEDCKNPTPVCLNGIAIENMQTGCVEVWASDLLEYAFDNCSSEGFVESTAKIRQVGVTTAPQGALELCCDNLGVVGVEIWVEDEAGNADYCTTYIVVQDNLGNCPDEASKAMIAGHIETYQGEMVEDVMVEVNGGASFLPTSVDGTYAFPSLSMNNSYTVVPEKDTDPINGVSTFDLVLMSQHILGINEFASPYQLIAADVNGDGNISTFDVVQNRQLILYLIDDFPTNTSWRFVDKDYVFPNSQNPWLEAFPEVINYASLNEDEMAADFIGIKIGDVNGDAVVNSLLGAEDRNFNGSLNFRLQDQTIEKNTKVTLPVSAANFNQINGFQYSMNFDASSLDFVGIESGAIQMTTGNIGTRFADEGILTTSWNTEAATTISNEEVLFSLVFNAKAATTVSNAIDISSRYTTAEAYSSTDLLEVVLGFENENGTLVNNRFELLQNQPNPFNGETVIGFTLPQASAATVKVFDVSGQLLKVIEANYNKGYNQITLSSKDLAVKGLLYYELTTSTDSATKKMLIIE